MSLIRLYLIFISEKKYKFICMWIIVYVVLYNILINKYNEQNKEKEWQKIKDKEEHNISFLNLSQCEQIENIDKRKDIKYLVFNQLNNC